MIVNRIDSIPQVRPAHAARSVRIPRRSRTAPRARKARDTYRLRTRPRPLPPGRPRSASTSSAMGEVISMDPGDNQNLFSARPPPAPARHAGPHRQSALLAGRRRLTRRSSRLRHPQRLQRPHADRAASRLVLQVLAAEVAPPASPWPSSRAVAMNSLVVSQSLFPAP